jgi:hypothetical protein
MPVTPTTTTYVFGASGAKISKLLTDPSGGSATYATGITVPGLKSVEISYKSNTKDLRGDQKLIASLSIVESAEVKLMFAKWDQNLWSIFTGATVTTDTTTGNSSSTFSAGQTGSYFKLNAVSYAASGVGSNILINLPKLIVTTPPPINLKEEDFAAFEVVAQAVPLESTGEWLTWTYNTTAVAPS